MKVLIVGDCHGAEGIYTAARLLRELNGSTPAMGFTPAIEAMIILGDVWDVNLPNVDTGGVPIHVIPGNHEKWGLWAKNEFGPNFVPHRDYETFFLGDRKFGVIGRIDDTPIVRDLIANGLGLGEVDKIFFERLEGEQVRAALGGSDFLLFHDAPYPFVLGHRPLPKDPNWKGAGEVVKGREVVGSDYLNEVVRTIHPAAAFHAHMHLRDIRNIGKTDVYGLPPIDPSFTQRGYAILDTETMEVVYRDLR